MSLLTTEVESDMENEYYQFCCMDCGKLNNYSKFHCEGCEDPNGGDSEND